MTRKNTKTENRILEEMQKGVAVNDWQELPVYDQAKGQADYLSEWEKRNNAEIANTRAFDFQEQIRVIDGTCFVSVGYAHKKDEKGNNTQDDDTTRPLIKFKWYDALNAGHIYMLVLPPERLKGLYAQLPSSNKWDTVFPLVTYTTANGLIVSTSARRYDSKQAENLASSEYAFRVWPQVEIDKKTGKAQEVIKTYTPEPTEENPEPKTYYMHYLNGSAGMVELVKIN